ncbi:glycerate dehydrogenase [Dyadobacter koreensis]|uniref:Glycerate dehydrogenase n=1 Tax=Dyadobacter koreensis TaxID=408657 RepID=A0A1H6SVK1_9BACT|nr:NAD(P)-dependent oxidoreductase [Dyadobacter koreensis]SEI69804.1 glycerate dehydrogenase [Dyadobacter koreensis]
MKIVVLDKMNFLADFPKMSFDCNWQEFQTSRPDQVLERLSGAQIAVTHKTVLNESHFSKLPDLKLITTNSTGYNTIDEKAAARYGIVVCNVQDWCTNAVVEHVLGFIFSLKRNILPYHLDIRSGLWNDSGTGSYALLHPPKGEIAGSTLGIIGYGNLGRLLKQKATGLGMKVLISDRKGVQSTRKGYVAFTEVITKSDIIVLLAPLNDDTYKMIAAQELVQMKPSTILINCGRGGLVDETDLANALIDNIIPGAGIDVFEQEPPRQDNPLMTYTGNNLLISSHVAFSSLESIACNTNQIVNNIEQYHLGSPSRVVNRHML